MERGHVDDVVEGATSGLQHCAEIAEGEPHLRLEVGLGRAILAAATWPETNRRSPERVAAE